MTVGEGSSPLRIQRLISKPSAQDLRRFLVIAQTERAVVFQYVWTDAGINEEFLLTVCQRDAGRTEWGMLSRSGAGALELWSTISQETETIANRINESLNRMSRTKPEKDQFDTILSLPRVKEEPSIQQLEPTVTFDHVPIIEDARALTSAPDVLKGNLTLVSMTNLLQSIKLDRMSGRLRIQRQSAFADIFFEDGVPTHAEGSRGVGEECILQAIGWLDGDFQFEHKLKTDEKTVSIPMDRLLLDGAMLMDCTAFLKKSGLQMTSTLVVRDKGLSIEKLLAFLKQQQTADPVLEGKLYEMIDGRRTVQEIVEALWLTRSRWVLSLSSLLRLELIGVRQSGGRLNALNVEPKPIDPAIIETVENQLLRDDTGLYEYSSFLYLLNHHMNSTPDVPLSVILLALHAGRDRGGASRAEVSSEGFQLLWREIVGVSAFRGIISHYEDELALVVFNSEPTAVERTAKGIIKSLPSSILELAMTSTDSISLSIGSASFPTDASDLGSLLAVAERAREQARTNGGGLVMARDLEF